MQHKVKLLASVGSIMPVVPHFNAHAGWKLWICATAQPNDLTQSEYAALTWIEVKSVGSHGETGDSTNILTYDTWGESVVTKAKGMTNAGDPEVELARLPADPGQDALRVAARTNTVYAFRITANDVPNDHVNSKPTTFYNRGLVVGPRRPHGRNEDFDLEVYTLALVQQEITVDAVAGGVAPEFTAIPTITGTAQEGEELTASTGTATGDATIVYTYQWFSGGVPIFGATANAYTLTADEVGEIVTVEVTATNDSGFAQATSAPTTAVIAA